jgi:hypothetical protein
MSDPLPPTRKSSLARCETTLHGLIAERLPGVVDALALLSQLQQQWTEHSSKDLDGWGELVPMLLRLVNNIVAGIAENPTKACFAQDDCWTALTVTEEVSDGLQNILEQLYGRNANAEPRSTDGILHADQGVFPLFEGCTKATLKDAMQIVDTTCATDGVYWFCKDCERPTSEGV